MRRIGRLEARARQEAEASRSRQLRFRADVELGRVRAASQFLQPVVDSLRAMDATELHAAHLRLNSPQAGRRAGEGGPSERRGRGIVGKQRARGGVGLRVGATRAATSGLWTADAAGAAGTSTQDGPSAVSGGSMSSGAGGSDGESEISSGGTASSSELAASPSELGTGTASAAQDPH